MSFYDAWLEPPDEVDEENERFEPDPDEARQRGIDDPDLFDERGPGPLWREYDA